MPLEPERRGGWDGPRHEHGGEGGEPAPFPAHACPGFRPPQAPAWLGQGLR